MRLLLQSLGRGSFFCFTLLSPRGLADYFEYYEAEDDIPDLQLDLDIIDRLKHRVSLARRIDAVVHKHTKADHEKNWLKQAAKDLDVEIDPDFVQYVRFWTKSSTAFLTKRARQHRRRRWR